VPHIIRLSVIRANLILNLLTLVSTSSNPQVNSMIQRESPDVAGTKTDPCFFCH